MPGNSQGLLEEYKTDAAHDPGDPGEDSPAKRDSSVTIDLKMHCFEALQSALNSMHDSIGKTNLLLKEVDSKNHEEVLLIKDKVLNCFKLLSAVCTRVLASHETFGYSTVPTKIRKDFLVFVIQTSQKLITDIALSHGTLCANYPEVDKWMKSFSSAINEMESSSALLPSHLVAGKELKSSLSAFSSPINEVESSDDFPFYHLIADEEPESSLSSPKQDFSTVDSLQAHIFLEITSYLLRTKLKEFPNIVENLESGNQKEAALQLYQNLNSGIQELHNKCLSIYKSEEHSQIDKEYVRCFVSALIEETKILLNKITSQHRTLCDHSPEIGKWIESFSFSTLLLENIDAVLGHNGNPLAHNAAIQKESPSVSSAHVNPASLAFSTADDSEDTLSTSSSSIAETEERDTAVPEEDEQSKERSTFPAPSTIQENSNIEPKGKNATDLPPEEQHITNEPEVASSLATMRGDGAPQGSPIASSMSDFAVATEKAPSADSKDEKEAAVSRSRTSSLAFSTADDSEDTLSTSSSSIAETEERDTAVPEEDEQSKERSTFPAPSTIQENSNIEPKGKNATDLPPEEQHITNEPEVASSLATVRGDGAPQGSPIASSMSDFAVATEKAPSADSKDEKEAAVSRSRTSSLAFSTADDSEDTLSTSSSSIAETEERDTAVPEEDEQSKERSTFPAPSTIQENSNIEPKGKNATDLPPEEQHITNEPEVASSLATMRGDGAPQGSPIASSMSDFAVATEKAPSADSKDEKEAAVSRSRTSSLAFSTADDSEDTLSTSSSSIAETEERDTAVPEEDEQSKERSTFPAPRTIQENSNIEPKGKNATDLPPEEQHITNEPEVASSLATMRGDGAPQGSPIASSMSDFAVATEKAPSADSKDEKEAAVSRSRTSSLAFSTADDSEDTLSTSSSSIAETEERDTAVSEEEASSAGSKEQYDHLRVCILNVPSPSLLENETTSKKIIDRVTRFIRYECSYVLGLKEGEATNKPLKTIKSTVSDVIKELDILLNTLASECKTPSSDRNAIKESIRYFSSYRNSIKSASAFLYNPSAKRKQGKENPGNVVLESTCISPEQVISAEDTENIVLDPIAEVSCNFFRQQILKGTSKLLSKLEESIANIEENDREAASEVQQAVILNLFSIENKFLHILGDEEEPQKRVSRRILISFLSSLPNSTKELVNNLTSEYQTLCTKYPKIQEFLRSFSSYTEGLGRCSDDLDQFFEERVRVKPEAAAIDVHFDAENISHTFISEDKQSSVLQSVLNITFAVLREVDAKVDRAPNVAQHIALKAQQEIKDAIQFIQDISFIMFGDYTQPIYETATRSFLSSLSRIAKEFIDSLPSKYPTLYVTYPEFNEFLSSSPSIHKLLGISHLLDLVPDPAPETEEDTIELAPQMLLTPQQYDSFRENILSVTSYLLQVELVAGFCGVSAKLKRKERANQDASKAAGMRDEIGRNILAIHNKCLNILGSRKKPKTNVLKYDVIRIVDAIRTVTPIFVNYFLDASTYGRLCNKHPEIVSWVATLEQDVNKLKRAADDFLFSIPQDSSVAAPQETVSSVTNPEQSSSTSQDCIKAVFRELLPYNQCDILSRQLFSATSRSLKEVERLSNFSPNVDKEDIKEVASIEEEIKIVITAIRDSCSAIFGDLDYPESDVLLEDATRLLSTISNISNELIVDLVNRHENLCAKYPTISSCLNSLPHHMEGLTDASTTLQELRTSGYPNFSPGTISQKTADILCLQQHRNQLYATILNVTCYLLNDTELLFRQFNEIVAGLEGDDAVNALHMRKMILTGILSIHKTLVRPSWNEIYSCALDIQKKALLLVYRVAAEHQILCNKHPKIRNWLQCVFDYTNGLGEDVRDFLNQPMLATPKLSHGKNNMHSQDNKPNPDLLSAKECDNLRSCILDLAVSTLNWLRRNFDKSAKDLEGEDKKQALLLLQEVTLYITDLKDRCVNILGNDLQPNTDVPIKDIVEVLSSALNDKRSGKLVHDFASRYQTICEIDSVMYRWLQSVSLSLESLAPIIASLAPVTPAVSQVDPSASTSDANPPHSGTEKVEVGAAGGAVPRRNLQSERGRSPGEESALTSRPSHAGTVVGVFDRGFLSEEQCRIVHTNILGITSSLLQSNKLSQGLNAIIATLEGKDREKALKMQKRITTCVRGIHDSCLCTFGSKENPKTSVPVCVADGFLSAVHSISSRVLDNFASKYKPLRDKHLGFAELMNSIAADMGDLRDNADALLQTISAYRTANVPMEEHAYSASAADLSYTGAVAEVPDRGFLSEEQRHFLRANILGITSHLLQSNELSEDFGTIIATLKGKDRKEAEHIKEEATKLILEMHGLCTGAIGSDEEPKTNVPINDAESAISSVLDLSNTLLRELTSAHKTLRNKHPGINKLMNSTAPSVEELRNNAKTFLQNISTLSTVTAPPIRKHTHSVPDLSYTGAVAEVPDRGFLSEEQYRTFRANTLGITSSMLQSTLAEDLDAIIATLKGKDREEAERLKKEITRFIMDMHNHCKNVFGSDEQPKNNVLVNDADSVMHYIHNMSRTFVDAFTSAHETLRSKNSGIDKLMNFTTYSLEKLRDNTGTFLQTIATLSAVTTQPIRKRTHSDPAPSTSSAGASGGVSGDFLSEEQRHIFRANILGITSHLLQSNELSEDFGAIIATLEGKDREEAEKLKQETTNLILEMHTLCTGAIGSDEQPKTYVLVDDVKSAISSVLELSSALLCELTSAHETLRSKNSGIDKFMNFTASHMKQLRDNADTLLQTISAHGTATTEPVTTPTSTLSTVTPAVTPPTLAHGAVTPPTRERTHSDTASGSSSAGATGGVSGGFLSEEQRHIFRATILEITSYLLKGTLSKHFDTIIATLEGKDREEAEKLKQETTNLILEMHTLCTGAIGSDEQPKTNVLVNDVKSAISFVRNTSSTLLSKFTSAHETLRSKNSGFDKFMNFTASSLEQLRDNAETFLETLSAHSTATTEPVTTPTSTLSTVTPAVTPPTLAHGAVTPPTRERTHSDTASGSSSAGASGGVSGDFLSEEQRHIFRANILGITSHLLQSNELSEDFGAIIATLEGKDREEAEKLKQETTNLILEMHTLCTGAIGSDEQPKTNVLVNDVKSAISFVRNTSSTLLSKFTSAHETLRSKNSGIDKFMNFTASSLEQLRDNAETFLETLSAHSTATTEPVTTPTSTLSTVTPAVTPPTLAHGAVTPPTRERTHSDPAPSPAPAAGAVAEVPDRGFLSEEQRHIFRANILGITSHLLQSNELSEDLGAIITTLEGKDREEAEKLKQETTNLILEMHTLCTGVIGSDEQPKTNVLVNDVKSAISFVRNTSSTLLSKFTSAHETLRSKNSGIDKFMNFTASSLEQLRDNAETFLETLSAHSTATTEPVTTPTSTLSTVTPAVTPPTLAHGAVTPPTRERTHSDPAPSPAPAAGAVAEVPDRGFLSEEQRHIFRATILEITSYLLKGTLSKHFDTIIATLEGKDREEAEKLKQETTNLILEMHTLCTGAIGSDEQPKTNVLVNDVKSAISFVRNTSSTLLSKFTSAHETLRSKNSGFDKFMNFTASSLEQLRDNAETFLETLSAHSTATTEPVTTPTSTLSTVTPAVTPPTLAHGAVTPPTRERTHSDPAPSPAPAAGAVAEVPDRGFLSEEQRHIFRANILGITSHLLQSNELSEDLGAIITTLEGKDREEAEKLKQETTNLILEMHTLCTGVIGSDEQPKTNVLVNDVKSAISFVRNTSSTLLSKFTSAHETLRSKNSGIDKFMNFTASSLEQLRDNAETFLETLSAHSTATTEPVTTPTSTLSTVTPAVTPPTLAHGAVTPPTRERTHSDPAPSPAPAAGAVAEVPDRGFLSEEQRHIFRATILEITSYLLKGTLSKHFDTIIATLEGKDREEAEKLKQETTNLILEMHTLCTGAIGSDEQPKTNVLVNDVKSAISFVRNTSSTLLSKFTSAHETLRSKNSGFDKFMNFTASSLEQLRDNAETFLETLSAHSTATTEPVTTPTSTLSTVTPAVTPPTLAHGAVTPPTRERTHSDTASGSSSAGATGGVSGGFLSEEQCRRLRTKILGITSPILQSELSEFSNDFPALLSKTLHLGYDDTKRALRMQQTFNSKIHIIHSKCLEILGSEEEPETNVLIESANNLVSLVLGEARGMEYDLNSKYEDLCILYPEIYEFMRSNYLTILSLGNINDFLDQTLSTESAVTVPVEGHAHSGTASGSSSAGATGGVSDRGFLSEEQRSSLRVNTLGITSYLLQSRLPENFGAILATLEDKDREKAEKLKQKTTNLITDMHNRCMSVLGSDKEPKTNVPVHDAESAISTVRDISSTLLSEFTSARETLCSNKHPGVAALMQPIISFIGQLEQNANASLKTLSRTAKVPTHAHSDTASGSSSAGATGGILAYFLSKEQCHDLRAKILGVTSSILQSELHNDFRTLIEGVTDLSDEEKNQVLLMQQRFYDGTQTISDKCLEILGSKEKPETTVPIRSANNLLSIVEEEARSMERSFKYGYSRFSIQNPQIYEFIHSRYCSPLRALWDISNFLNKTPSDAVSSSNYLSKEECGNLREEIIRIIEAIEPTWENQRERDTISGLRDEDIPTVSALHADAMDVVNRIQKRYMDTLIDSRDPILDIPREEAKDLLFDLAHISRVFVRGLLFKYRTLRYRYPQIDEYIRSSTSSTYKLYDLNWSFSSTSIKSVNAFFGFLSDGEGSRLLAHISKFRNKTMKDKLEEFERIMPIIEGKDKQEALQMKDEICQEIESIVGICSEILKTKTDKPLTSVYRARVKNSIYNLTQQSKRLHGFHNAYMTLLNKHPALKRWVLSFDSAMFELRGIRYIVPATQFPITSWGCGIFWSLPEVECDSLRMVTTSTISAMDRYVDTLKNIVKERVDDQAQKRELSSLIHKISSTLNSLCKPCKTVIGTYGSDEKISLKDALDFMKRFTNGLQEIEACADDYFSRSGGKNHKVEDWINHFILQVVKAKGDILDIYNRYLYVAPHIKEEMIQSEIEDTSDRSTEPTRNLWSTVRKFFERSSGTSSSHSADPQQASTVEPIAQIEEESSSASPQIHDDITNQIGVNNMPNRFTMFFRNAWNATCRVFRNLCSCGSSSTVDPVQNEDPSAVIQEEHHEETSQARVESTPSRSGGFFRNAWNATCRFFRALCSCGAGYSQLHTEEAEEDTDPLAPAEEEGHDQPSRREEEATPEPQMHSDTQVSAHTTVVEDPKTMNVAVPAHSLSDAQIASQGTPPTVTH